MIKSKDLYSVTTADNSHLVGVTLMPLPKTPWKQNPSKECVLVQSPPLTRKILLLFQARVLCDLIGGTCLLPWYAITKTTFLLSGFFLLLFYSVASDCLACVRACIIASSMMKIRKRLTSFYTRAKPFLVVLAAEINKTVKLPTTQLLFMCNVNVWMIPVNSKITGVKTIQHNKSGTVMSSKFWIRW